MCLCWEHPAFSKRSVSWIKALRKFGSSSRQSKRTTALDESLADQSVKSRVRGESPENLRHHTTRRAARSKRGTNIRLYFSDHSTHMLDNNAESFLPGGRGDCVQVSAVQGAATGRRKTFWTKPHASTCYGY